MIKRILSLVFLFSALFSSAQEVASTPQMADTFRSEGKIYVVITVIGMIFIATQSESGKDLPCLSIPQKPITFRRSTQ